MYNRRLTKRIAKVNLVDVDRVAQKYLSQFLDADSSQLAVVCGPNEVKNVINVFKEWGFDLHHIEDIENSFLAE